MACAVHEPVLGVAAARSVAVQRARVGAAARHGVALHAHAGAVARIGLGLAAPACLLDHLVAVVRVHGPVLVAVEDDGRHGLRRCARRARADRGRIADRRGHQACSPPRAAGPEVDADRPRTGRDRSAASTGRHRAAADRPAM
jgi:hypothetical protein